MVLPNTGMDVEVRGSTCLRTRALRFEPRIVSDVTAIGSVVDGSFVSQLMFAIGRFGFLSRLQKTVFIERRPRYARNSCWSSGRLRSAIV